MKNLLRIPENNLIDKQIANITPDPPKKTKADVLEGLVLNYMEEYGITNPYMQSAMMGIILNEGGFSENVKFLILGKVKKIFGGSLQTIYNN